MCLRFFVHFCAFTCLCDLRIAGGVLSNFISSPSDRKKEKEKKLNNYTIQHNKTKSIDKLSYI